MLEKVNEILMEMGFLDQPPAKEMTLKDDLGLDSLKIVELIVALEDELHIEFDESDLDPATLETVDHIHALVKKYTEGKAYAIWILKKSYHEKSQQNHI